MTVSEWATPDRDIMHMQFSSGVTMTMCDKANGEHFARSW